jgi:hypothetical protein
VDGAPSLNQQPQKENMKEMEGKFRLDSYTHEKLNSGPVAGELRLIPSHDGSDSPMNKLNMLYEL